MTKPPLDLEKAWIFFVRNDAGGMSPVFLVDGRTYDDPEAVRRDMKEGWKHLQKTGVIFDIKTTWGRNMSVPRDVPTWHEYRETHRER